MRLFDTGAAFRAAAAAQVRRDYDELHQRARVERVATMFVANQLVRRHGGSVADATEDPRWPYLPYPGQHWWECDVPMHPDDRSEFLGRFLDELRAIP